ncbi:M20/M25/M40 family metallo-hydrolase [Saccharopolyspora sp. ID03-671]|uniref:M20/M25/M40 family metallo-hydrolase n=1 Tax=Saccharopolyspora sp. ID03-671 TaxID=3073066 RepID=UPI0032481BE7
MAGRAPGPGDLAGRHLASGRFPEGHPLLEETRQAIVAAGGPDPEVLGAPYGSDLRQYAATGMPTLTYGPGDVRYAHADDEHVTIADLEQCARTFVLLAINRCGIA